MGAGAMNTISSLQRALDIPGAEQFEEVQHALAVKLLDHSCPIHAGADSNRAVASMDRIAAFVCGQPHNKILIAAGIQPSGVRYV
jgi:hypothetical protein